MNHHSLGLDRDDSAPSHRDSRWPRMPVKGGGRLPSYPSKSENVGVSETFNTVWQCLTLHRVDSPQPDHVSLGDFSVGRAPIASFQTCVKCAWDARQPANGRVVSTPVVLHAATKKPCFTSCLNLQLFSLLFTNVQPVTRENWHKFVSVESWLWHPPVIVIRHRLTSLIWVFVWD